MFEALRKLTANYTEAEYEAWLYEECLADIPKGKNKVKIPTISEKEHIKDIACMLTEVALDTGYEPEFLYERFDEMVDELVDVLGEPIGKAHKEAFDFVAGVSYEQDW